MAVRLGIDDLGEGGLPFEDCPPPFLLDFSLGNRRFERFRQPLNSGYRRFNRLTTRNSLLDPISIMGGTVRERWNVRHNDSG